MTRARRGRGASAKSWWTRMDAPSFWSPSPPTFRTGTRHLWYCACLGLSRRSFPFITKAFADMGFAGDGPATATSIRIEIVRKPPDQVGFVVHPRRWVVERFFAWISRNRRLWKDPEATLASARAFLSAASVMFLIRRLARLS